MGDHDISQENHYISEITRNDIFDIIETGVDYLDKNGLQEHAFMPLYGRLTELRFLERLYNLKTMPSSDRRYGNAEGDIIQHTVNNDDWPDGWVFSDKRFRLNNGSEDSFILNFICELIHPAVRTNDDSWKHYLKAFNAVLANDGYELYPKMNLSGKEVYSYRRIDSVDIPNPIEKYNANLKVIGEGSYATAFLYHDDFYDMDVVVKRALSDLSEKEVARFEQEFHTLKRLNSPNIVRVYSISENPLQYTMERLDVTLESYILKRSSPLKLSVRKDLISQLLNALGYMHNKNILHRDLSPKNIMLKKYDDGSVVVKVTDFGLVKIPDSDLTSCNSKVKGSFNDPELNVSGFAHYSFEHEIYAITLVVMFIMTGAKSGFKETVKDPKLQAILEKGTNPNKDLRYKTLNELWGDIENLDS